MSEHTGTGAGRTQRAGLFDIRIIIGTLIGIYGVIVLLTAVLGSDANVDNAGPINLICGLAMIVVAAIFVVWARLRPIAVPETTEPARDADDTEGTPTAPTR